MRLSESQAGTKAHAPHGNPFALMEAKFLGGGPFDFDLTRHSILCVSKGVAVLELSDGDLKVNEEELLLISSQPGKSIPGWRGQFARSAVLTFCREAVVQESAPAESIEYLRAFEAGSRGTPQVISAPKDVIEEICDLIGRIKKESESGGRHSPLAMKTYLKMILVLLCQQMAEISNAPNEEPGEVARIKPLLQYLAQNYMESITVGQAAQVLNMSNSHFMRYFRQATGSAFVPYLNRLRISKAQALLTQSRLSITEVGEAVGFCDHSYFSSIFRRFSGIGPREFRNQLRKESS